MNAGARWQEIISENLASASVPGFKRQDVSFQSVSAGTMEQEALPPHLRFRLAEGRPVTQFQQGELRSTGVPTDVAIQGEGFFEVEMPSGATGYTRDGEFHISAQGTLVTKQGYAVLGEGGAIQLDLNASGPLSISPTGEVSQGGISRGTLKISSFSQPQRLTPVGGGIFISNDINLRAAEVPQPNLRSGFLEAANTSVVTEMANLISSMRYFEINQKMLQMHDENMGRTITQLGTPL